MANTAQYEIKTLTRSNWPPLLEEINQLPEKLFYAGQLPDWSRKLLCVVGARKYTGYGKEVVSSLIDGLKNYPVSIVSGLALGVDALAHEAALRNNLPTIAVPGSGLALEVLHPQSNALLAQKIVEQGGTLLNEFEPEFKAVYWSFPQRNRIMAGMSHATLVIEAEKKSGTLITARLATEYNRDVLTVPHSIFNTTGEGPHLLIRLGATPIRHSDDILEALHLENQSASTNTTADDTKYFDCSEKEMLVVKILSEPLPRDQILRTMKDEHQTPTSETQMLLSLLELKGLIKETLGEIRLT